MTDESRRPTAVVERDRSVASALATAAKPLATVSEELGLSKNQVYGSMWRLRQRGFVVKTRVGGRTPVWGLTAEGQADLQQPVAAPAPEPAPAPAEAPAEAPAPPPEVPTF